MSMNILFYFTIAYKSTFYKVVMYVIAFVHNPVISKKGFEI